TNQNNGTVLLFTRPTDGVYPAPKIIRLDGKSTEQEIDVMQGDQPNFFVEAITVHGGHTYSAVREVIVPPRDRMLNVAVTPSQKEFKPGDKGTVKIKLTDHRGKPVVGNAVLTIYDRSVGYVSDGANVEDIKEFFWKWRRYHDTRAISNLNGTSDN